MRYRGLGYERGAVGAADTAPGFARRGRAFPSRPRPLNSPGNPSPYLSPKVHR
jgi:hypothetical protein